MVDMLASEYGWTVMQALETPVDQTQQLMHAIMHRKGLATMRKHLSYDTLDKPLSERMRDIFAEIDKAE